MRQYSDSNYIVEMIQVGEYVKVTAIDPMSGREVSMVGDPTRPEKELQDIAVRKLLYVLKKEKQERQAGQDNEKTDFEI